jgi:hypothetical protein
VFSLKVFLQWPEQEEVSRCKKQLQELHRGKGRMRVDTVVEKQSRTFYPEVCHIVVLQYPASTAALSSRISRQMCPEHPKFQQYLHHILQRLVLNFFLVGGVMMYLQSTDAAFDVRVK